MRTCLSPVVYCSTWISSASTKPCSEQAERQRVCPSSSGTQRIRNRLIALSPGSPEEFLTLAALEAPGPNRNFQKGEKAPRPKWVSRGPAWILGRSPQNGRGPPRGHLLPGPSTLGREPWGPWEMPSKTPSTILKPLDSCSPPAFRGTF